MQGWSPVSLARETTAVMLLVHTVAITLYLCVSAILLKALFRLRRTGERLVGFLAIAVLIFAASLARAAWLGMVWFNLLPPAWLDLVIVCLAYVGVMGTPIILSWFYLPTETTQGRRSRTCTWLHWAMAANAVSGAATLPIAFVRDSLSVIFFGIPAVCGTAVLLLCARIAYLRNIQVRRRGLALFAFFTSAGLLTVGSVVLYGGIYRVQVRRSAVTGTLLEFSSLLIVVGMLFVFANLRLADVIVKRVLRLVLWLCAALSVWVATMVLVRILPFRPGIRPDAVRYLLSVVLIAVFGAATPACLRLLDRWIDRWLFQQPDFDAAIRTLWDRLVSRETAAEVFHEAAEIIRETLSLSAVRMMPSRGSGDADDVGVTGLHPPSLQPAGMEGQPKSGSADVLMPLFLEGSAAHWIVLSRGIMRPPLTAMELGFVERAAARIQIRMQTILAEERRIETMRRETAFRQELTEAELRALRAQINPHFLFNSLNTIADLTVTAPHRAEQMTLRLSAVFRYVLVNTEKQFASLREEIDFARSYLAIEEFRFGDRLHTNFEIEPGLLEERVPTLLLQPMIENALKHGLAPRRSGGTISIVAKSTPTGLTLTVGDDGVGLRENVDVASATNTHVGLTNIRKRLATAYQGASSFSLRPRAGGGTEAIVVIEKGR